MKNRSEYTVTTIDGVVCITDIGTGAVRSVTNDIENVIFDLKAKGIIKPDSLVIYMDSEYQWDGIALTPAVGFKHFIPLAETSAVKAINAIKLKAKEKI